MNSVPRKLTLGLAVALVAAACGDKVTVTNPPAVTPPTPVVRSVIVSPSAATISQGSSFTFGAAVDADSPLPVTVTWTIAGGTGITIDQSGVATASATATGVASVCAASKATGFEGIKGCAQLTITAGAAAATVNIDAITVGCSALNTALSPAGCGLQTPVQVNNVGGQIDISALIRGATNTKVVFQVLDATGATVLKSYTQTLTANTLGSDGLALQQQSDNRVVQSVNTAEYDLGGTGGAARVFFLNGEHQIKVCLSSVVDSCTGAGQTAVALRTVTFRNANGFHMAITTVLTSGTLNANGINIRQTNAATGLSYVGGTPLALSAIPVSYTGQVAALTPSTVLSFGGVCGTQRNIVAGGSGSVLTGTLTYTAGSTTTTGTVNVYEAPSATPVAACTLAGEVPFAAALDATGNAFINFPLFGNYANNTLNNILNPVVPTLPTVSPIRLDNKGPAAITGYFPNPNKRVNGWYNLAVKLNVVNSGSNPDGAVLGAGAGDAGIAGTVTLQARGGVCTTPAGCAALPIRTDVTGLAETPLGTSDQFIVQTVDLFGNFTTPGTTNLFGVDVTIPTVTNVQSWAAGVTQFNIANGLLPNTSTWTVTAIDVAPALPAVASGIRSSVAAPAGTGDPLYDGLEMTLSTRSATGTNFFCPGAAQFQASATPCATAALLSGWSTGTTFGRGPGVAIALDPALVFANTDAYYQIVANSIDQAGNRSTVLTNTVISDKTIPTNFGLNVSPVPAVGAGTVTATVGGTDNLDVALSHFGFNYGTTTFAAAGTSLLYPFTTTGSGLQGANPIGFNAVGPSILAFSFTQGNTPYMRSVLQVPVTNLITAPVLLADINGNTVRAVTQDVAGNLTAVAAAIPMTTNTPALPAAWVGATAVPPGGQGFNGQFTATSSIATVNIAGGTAATRTVTFSAKAISLSTLGWQAPFTGGGLDFWVLDATPFRSGYIRACTAATPQYTIGDNSWNYSCSWTPGSSVANGYQFPLVGLTTFVAIGRNVTGDGLATFGTALTIGA